MQSMGTKISFFNFSVPKGGVGVEKFPLLKTAGVIFSSELGSLEAASDGILLPRKRGKKPLQGGKALMSCEALITHGEPGLIRSC